MTEQLRFKVEGMDCASCAAKVETAVARLPGVGGIRVNTTTETLTLSAENQDIVQEVAKVVRALGYRPAFLGNGHRHSAADAGAGGRAHEHGREDGREDPHAAASMAEVRAWADQHDHAGSGGGRMAPRQEQRVAGGPEYDHDGADEHEHGAPIEGRWWRSGRGRLVLGTGFLIALAFAAAQGFPAAADWIFAAACLVAGVPIARHALQAARHGSILTIEMLMTIAVAGAFVIGEAAEAAIVVFLFTVGELLEAIAAGRARAGIKALATIAPKTAQVETPEGVIEMPVERIAIGAIVVVRPGDRVPADGRILSGSSSVDESALTGESMPKSKSAGDTVFAGAINTEAALRIKVEKLSSDTLIARVVHLVEEATEAKSPTARFIDRFSRYYMPVVCVLALAVAVLPPLGFGQPWDVWIYRGLTLLLIGCPCALVISVPASIASALAAGARRGLLVKGGAVLERVGAVKHVALDKTGTLTEGRPRVTDVVRLGAMEGSELLRLAGALEATSSHPLAVAVVDHARTLGIAVASADGSRALAGKGLAGRVDGHEVVIGAASRLGLDARTVERSIALEHDGKSVSVIVVDGTPAGLIALRDEPRADSKGALDEMRRLGLKPVMLTGDNRAAGEAIALVLGIEARTELLPEDKLRHVKALAEDGGVIKVGDGINDAPALAAATVGVAMGSGTDVAMEAADAAVLRNRIGDVAALVKLSRRTMRVIRQNVSIALGLKAIFLVTTIFGFTGLWMAILADTGATVLVTGNALRLLRRRD